LDEITSENIGFNECVIGIASAKNTEKPEDHAGKESETI
jgi:hypothetical protein